MLLGHVDIPGPGYLVMLIFMLGCPSCFLNFNIYLCLHFNVREKAFSEINLFQTYDYFFQTTPQCTQQVLSDAIRQEMDRVTMLISIPFI